MSISSLFQVKGLELHRQPLVDARIDAVPDVVPGSVAQSSVACKDASAVKENGSSRQGSPAVDGR
jgi:hypothetical protein